MAEPPPQQQRQTTRAPRHVPLSEITHQGLLRGLGAESEALQKIHVRIQRQLQNLEMEEKLLKQMIQRERDTHSADDLQQFDAEMHQGKQQQHLQLQQGQTGGQQQQQQEEPE